MSKEDRIFGFSNYNDFKSKYFNKEVVALENKHRIKSIKEARLKYAKRYSAGNYT